MAMAWMCRVCHKKMEDEFGWNPTIESLLTAGWYPDPDGALCPEHRPHNRKRERRKLHRRGQ